MPEIAADPNAEAVGFDITQPSPARLHELGVRLAEPVLAEELADGDLWMAHSEYLGQAPEHDEMDRAYARLAAREHLESHGTPGSLRLLRSFPCLGKFRHVSERHVMCDACGAELGLRPTGARAEGADAAAAGANPTDDIPF